MLFLTEQELESQTVPANNAKRIIFQNKLFAREISFPKSYRQLAIYMAKMNSDKNIQTIIVEHESDLSVWSELNYEQEIEPGMGDWILGIEDP